MGNALKFIMQTQNIKMKRIIIFSSLLLIIGLSCNKVNFNYPKGTVGSSRIVYFATISTNGGKIVATQQGDPYTDQGATATVNNAPINYTTDGTVDINTPGVYTLTYTATNAEGFSSSDWRMVVVVPVGVWQDPVVKANDFSGVYLRGTVTSTWTKIATGVYQVENPGGSSGVGKLVAAVNYSDHNIQIPPQNAPDFGQVKSSDESYTVGPPTTYSWKFFAPGYGTQLRTFVKQQ
ncbi:MAG: hypothetical protein C5B59_01470 [Bacteroidetes bacterium]|nr:MAG: hypothetical protein C5B59_01470 [Bacteroidota bacterium]